MTLPRYSAKAAGEIVGALKVGASLEEAARAAGVTPEALASWTRRPAFAKRVQEAREGAAVAASTRERARVGQAASAVGAGALRRFAGPGGPAAIAELSPGDGLRLMQTGAALQDRARAEDDLARLRALTTDS